MSFHKLLSLCLILTSFNNVYLNVIYYWIPQIDDALNTNHPVVRTKILEYHNYYRSKVRPPASNMLYMSWHHGAAKQAEIYANKCIFGKHNSGSERTVPHLGSCGQNIYTASYKSSWFLATKSWFSEVQNFTYGNPYVDVPAVGHYTQLVWATSFKVGCAVAECYGGPWGYFYNYVCHYCPGGNHITVIQYPYKAGRPCNDCPHQCLDGKLCLNSCHEYDVYDNCKKLASFPGYCKYGTCNATCNCGNKRIHQNYPF